jgi:hypothetical protein
MVRDGASLRGFCVSITDNQGFGLVVQNGSNAQISGAEIRLTRSLPAAAEPAHPGVRIGGFNLLVLNATLALDHFVSAQADGCGLLIGQGAEVDASQGEVSFCPIGICLQAEGYDISRLRNVAVRECQRNFDASTLPISVPDIP